jgi:hypothetical protein
MIERDLWIDESLTNTSTLEFPLLCTFEEAQKVMFQHFANKRSKSAVMLRDYLRYFLNKKFMQHYQPFWHRVGRSRMEKWAPMVRKISFIAPLQPMIDIKPMAKQVKKELMSKDLVTSEHFKQAIKIKEDAVEKSLEKFDAEVKASRENIIAERKARQAARQQTIDMLNNEKMDTYARELQEYNQDRDANVVSLCNIEYVKPEQNFFSKKKKAYFLGIYNNGYKKRILPTFKYDDSIPENIKNDQKILIHEDVTSHCPVDTFRYECESIWCKKEPHKCRHDSSMMEKVYDHEACKYRGFICDQRVYKTAYYTFNISEFDIVDITKIQAKKPESLKLIPEASMSKTPIIEHSCSSLGIAQKKLETPPSQNEENAWIEVVQKRKELGKFKRNMVLDSISKNKDFVTNRFTILQNFKAEMEINRYANYSKPDVIVDNIEKTQSPDYQKKKEKITKKHKATKTKLAKRVTEMNLKFDIQKRMSLKNVILCILNSKLHKEVKIDKCKGFTDEILYTYLHQGYIDRKSTHLNKGVRKVMTRILDNFLIDVMN